MLTLFFTASGIGVAYAQDSSSIASQFYSPETDALKTFATEIATSAPKIIAAAVLLIIGLVVGKLVARAVEKTAKKILTKASLHGISESMVVEEAVGRSALSTLLWHCSNGNR